MTNLLFLLVPIAVAATAVTILWLRSRPTTSPTAGIDQFSVQMQALAPEDTEPVVTAVPAEPARPPTGHAVVVDDDHTVPEHDVVEELAVDEHSVEDPAGDDPASDDPAGDDPAAAELAGDEPAPDDTMSRDV